ncbi:MAG: ABC transporter permease, partial [Candidatus Hydrogenedentota bacterium]
MRTVTKSFLRYLPRRRSLSLLQLMGIACGVAAAVGMTLSARAALSSFARAVEFLRGQATHSIARPAGPMDEQVLTQLMRDPAVTFFSPVIDRQLRLGEGELVRLLGVDPFLDQSIRPEITRFQITQERRTSEHRLSFLFDARAALVDARLADRLGVSTGDDVVTSRGVLRVVGTFSNPSGEPLVVMDIAHVQELFGLRGQIDRVDLILRDISDFRSRWEEGFHIQS